MCNHKGWALWMNNYSWYCANCGHRDIDFRLIPMHGAHRIGEPMGWELHPDILEMDGS